MKIEAIYEAQMTKGGNKVVVPITLRCKKCGDYNGGDPALKDVYLLKGFEQRLSEYFVNHDGQGTDTGVVVTDAKWERKGVRFEKDGNGVNLETTDMKFRFICNFVAPKPSETPPYEPLVFAGGVHQATVEMLSKYNPTFNDHVMRALYVLLKGSADYRRAACFTSIICEITPVDENDAQTPSVNIDPSVGDYSL